MNDFAPTFITCPECGKDHDAATAWAVQASPCIDSPSIVQLIWPSCHYMYKVIDGQLQAAINGDLRSRSVSRRSTLPVGMLLSLAIGYILARVF